MTRLETAGAWLELSVEADIEAVEAVSEILGRVASGGTTVEPAFDLVDEGLGARVDPTRPAVVRGYVPARDPSAAAAAAADIAEALGHLQAFGLRPIGELRKRIVHEADWAEAWKAYFPVLRIGRRLVIRPTWRRHRRAPGDVVLALDPGMAFGTGLHPTTRLCLAALEPLAEGGRLAGARVLDVGCGSGILAIAAIKLGADDALGLDTDPIAIESTIANARRNRLARHIRARAGTVPSGEPPYDVVLANLVAGLLVPLAPSLHDELRPGGTLLASGIFLDREDEVRTAFEAAGLQIAGRSDEGEWVALEVRRRAMDVASAAPGNRLKSRSVVMNSRPVSMASATGTDSIGRRPTIHRVPANLFPLLLIVHIGLAIGLFLPSILLPFALRTRRATVESESGLVRSLLFAQSHGTVVLGTGLALTGLGLVAVLGPSMLVQPWLLVALTVYFANLAIAFFIQRPNLRQLIGIKAAPDDRTWLERAKRQRYVSYLMAGLVGIIGFLMSTKPSL